MSDQIQRESVIFPDEIVINPLQKIIITNKPPSPFDNSNVLNFTTKLIEGYIDSETNIINKKLFWLILIFSILLLIAIGIMSYYIYLNNKQIKDMNIKYEEVINNIKENA